MSALADVPKEHPRPDLRVLEQFLYHEARLLDEQRWDEWEALWTPEGEYWVPSRPDQPDPVRHVSLVYETALLRKVRLKRYGSPNAFSLQPRPRSVHLLGNVMLDAHDPATGACTLNARFVMLQYRADLLDVFGGSVTHRLVPDGADWKIASKRVDLVNCDGALENILLYL